MYPPASVIAIFDLASPRSSVVRIPPRKCPTTSGVSDFAA
jgi:hypothetical protein